MHGRPVHWIGLESQSMASLCIGLDWNLNAWPTCALDWIDSQCTAFGYALALQSMYLCGIPNSNHASCAPWAKSLPTFLMLGILNGGPKVYCDRSTSSRRYVHAPPSTSQGHMLVAHCPHTMRMSTSAAFALQIETSAHLARYGSCQWLSVFALS